LDGDGINPGFLQIIDDFGGTESGELANYYAGMCYMHLAMNDTSAMRDELFDSAIEYLKDYDAEDVQTSALALGAIGDAYDELNDQEKAVEYYVKAANHSPNEFSSPKFLMKAGIVYSALNQHDKALEMFEKIKKDYYTSSEGREIKKYIAKGGLDLLYQMNKMSAISYA